MGTKTYKRRVTATSKTTEKSPATAELSSPQNIKKPRLKKSIPRRQIKSRLSRQRPVNNASQQKKGRGKSQDSKSHKRKIAYSQEKKLKTYYSSLTGHQGKRSTNSRVNSIPRKTAKKQAESNSSGMKVESGKSSHVSKTENPQPPLARRSRVSSPREKQRSKLTAVEKRRYQAVSEYQFIYPGKAVFHCIKGSMNQQLRSIYLGPRGQKSLKPTHQMSRSQWDKNKTQWQNSKTDASCLAGGKFLKSKHPNISPHKLTCLMHKINKLVLVSDIEMAPPSTPAEFPHNLQLQHQPAPLKSSLPAAILQRQNSSNERKASPEGYMGQESSSDSSPQGAPRNVLKVSHAGSAKLRPLSAKDCCQKALSKKSGREDHQNRDSSKKDAAAESTLGVRRSSKGGVTHSQSTSAMPAFHQFSSTENVNVKVLPQCLPKQHTIPS